MSPESARSLHNQWLQKWRDSHGICQTMNYVMYHQSSTSKQHCCKNDSQLLGNRKVSDANDLHNKASEVVVDICKKVDPKKHHI
ncbi:hypothetical protein MLD38_039738 [Melastoma candidum]|uniref:Uncharacterized protein n=1 Tax=Melastoma candidum TaxID=119954 RepID=A0ACB9L320_9MYRT|nr:hypothetical protein MLD38_039738 [Melastoma candidum]